jgi:uncharacterized RDD family membrane protein YckC
MHQVNVRQGATAGLIVSVVMAAAAAGSSTAPLQTFGLTLAVTLTATVGAIAFVLAVSRRPDARQTVAGPAPGVAFGGFWIRAVAYLIDIALLAIIDGALIWALGAAGQAIAGIVLIAYFVGLWGIAGRTIGMMLCGLRVVRNADGGKITWGHATLRFVGLCVAFACVYIGVIWVAFDARKRGWQDVIGGTAVIRDIG